MKRILPLASAFVAAVASAFLASCDPETPENPPDPGIDLPAIAVVSGADSNTKPDLTVTLTASSEGATSYVWYGPDGKIACETNDTYVVTESGAYYAAGVNARGQGETSAAKRVTIFGSEYDYDPAAIAGVYTASSSPQKMLAGDDRVPFYGPATWTSHVYYDAGDPENGVMPFIVASNFANVAVRDGSTADNMNSAGAILDIDENNRLMLDQETQICSTTTPTAFVRGFMMAMQVDTSNTFIGFLPKHEVKWDAVTGTIDMTPARNDGTEVLLLIVGVDAQTGEPKYQFSDGYKNVKLVRDAAGRASFAAERVPANEIDLGATHSFYPWVHRPI